MRRVAFTFGFSKWLLGPAALLVIAAGCYGTPRMPQHGTGGNGGAGVAGSRGGAGGVTGAGGPGAGASGTVGGGAWVDRRQHSAAPVGPLA